MSEDAELPEPEALAAEHALGMLTAEERATAELRMARDPDFAAAVESWRMRLAPMLGRLPPVEPSAGLWARIERALPANDNGDAARRLGLWRGTALGALGLAAASLLSAVLIVGHGPPPIYVTPQAPQMLSARIDTAKGAHLFVAAYDPSRQAVVVSSLVPAGTDPGHVHELWLIPADGKPRALGFVPVGASLAIPVSAPLAILADDRASLAISVEKPGGSKAPGPTGPVVASGKLSKI